LSSPLCSIFCSLLFPPLYVISPQPPQPHVLSLLSSPLRSLLCSSVDSLAALSLPFVASFVFFLKFLSFFVMFCSVYLNIAWLSTPKHLRKKKKSTFWCVACVLLEAHGPLHSPPLPFPAP
jgi:hypothetical protein